MTQPIEERLSYHPDPLAPASSDRKVGARLSLILSKVDFAGKTVLDLGCSGGFFSFSLAPKAGKVIAVDGDPEIIARNKAKQRELGITNIEFVHSPITKALIEKIGPTDVTLFLSVYHHMLTVSDAYGWNQGMDRRSAAEVIEAINEKTGQLVFEIGYPNEGFEWCARLPAYGGDWDDYVVGTIFNGRYSSVVSARPDIPMRWVNRALISRLSREYKEDPRVVQHLKSFFRFDPRDFRKIYFGTK